MNSSEQLRELLNQIDHKGYPAYKDTKGAWQFQGYVLSIDHVQGDPFAAPSKVSVRVKGGLAGFPKELYDTPWKKTALADELLRQFSRQADAFTFKAKGSGKSGLLSVSRCGQEVLQRSACEIDSVTGDVLVRMEVGFPANGRTINARELIKIFYEFLPVCVKKTLYYKALDKNRIARAVELSQDQHEIREQMAQRGLIAFVANGAVLPRESGISQKPMKDAVPFQSPNSMEIELELPFAGKMTGMGIKKGITLIVGGGYHGKSTLLEALERGVYDHIAGDGREYVITDLSAVKIRAEDGRSIKNVDISMFINGLPNGRDTKSFDTADASGSTSQAANVVEAMEAGSRLLLIDEDTSASNFMVRDELMQSVVSRASEPITPLIDRIRELYEDYGISSVIVAGSSGAYFYKADCILQMDRYEPVEITAFAREKAAEYAAQRMDTAPACVKPSLDGGQPSLDGVKPALDRGNPSLDCGKPSLGRIKPSFDRRPMKPRVENDRTKVKAFGRDGVQLNKENIDLRYVEQLVDTEQLMALGYMLSYAQSHLMDGRRTITEVVEKLIEIIDEKGLREICESSYVPAGLAMPRRQEIFACFDRYRGLRM